jgi:energy-coupling factor transporter ATP-binding protein EcfA2
VSSSEVITLPDNFEVTDEMHRVIDLINQKENIFITGKAGSGKSTLLTYLRTTCFPEETIFCAYTGVAALNIGGETLHKFFGFLPDITIAKVKSDDYHPKNQKIMKILKVLVIDEVSMVRADLIDIIDAALRKYGPRPSKPFGGVQIVMFGDLYQLPPIVTGDEREFFDENYQSELFFDANSWVKAPFEVIELTKVYRQKDQEFVDILNGIRLNDVSKEQIDRLNQLLDPDFSPSEEDFYITLTATKALSARINKEKLAAIDNPLHTSIASIMGQFSEKIFPTERFLEFKVGSQVMLINNDPDQRWANGTLARITAVSLRKDSKVEDVTLQLSSSGAEHVVERHVWDVLKPRYLNGRLDYEVVGSFKQFPFRLSWAVTVHKGQGKTFERVIIDFTHAAFAAGQMYVALSRCTTLDGMKLRVPISLEQIHVDNRVAAFFKSLKR